MSCFFLLRDWKEDSRAKKKLQKSARARARERVFSERESVSENEREETKEEKKIFFFPSLQKPKKKLEN